MSTRVLLQEQTVRVKAKEEIMEVLELVSVLGIHSCTLGVPVLLEELEALEQERSTDGGGG